MFVGVVIHLVVIPYADLTLLAANASLAIIINMAFSMVLFDEKFVWRYDLPAMICIIGGSLSIVFLSNKKQENKSGQDYLDLLKGKIAITYYTVVGIGLTVTYFILRAYYSSLR